MVGFFLSEIFQLFSLSLEKFSVGKIMEVHYVF